MGAFLSSHYETVAGAFQVWDIASPLLTFCSPEDAVEDVLSAIMEEADEDPDNFFALIREGNEILGYIAGDFIFDDANALSNGPTELLCTNFIDKKTIILRSPDSLGKLPFQSRREAERFFNQTENLRNQIAHSDTILGVLSTPDEFDGFVTELRRVAEAVSTLRTQLTG